MTKPPLLMLVHRIPYPPNKGDKIRSFNLLKALSEHYSIHLGCFVDDPYDMQFRSELNKWCAQVYCLRQSKLLAKLVGLTGFISGKPITLPYYFSYRMASWVRQQLQQFSIEHVLVYSSSMAQYVDSERYQHLNRLIDFVDIDSDKWAQYAQKKQGIPKWFFQREARLLQRYEISTCQQFNKSFFVSDDEAADFKALLNDRDKPRVRSLLNGVDVHYFNAQPYDAPAEMSLPARYLVFTGAMDYHANVDAVLWFCNNVWPTLKTAQPDLHFVIVGGNPTAEVKALSKNDGIIVTGRVKDVRPYIQHALFSVAPMLIARGIQNKVLEAMAMDKAVVCTSMAMEGINAPASPATPIADDAAGFIQACQSLLIHPLDHIGNRDWIVSHFTWHDTLKPLPSYFGKETGV